MFCRTCDRRGIRDLPTTAPLGSGYDSSGAYYGHLKWELGIWDDINDHLEEFSLSEAEKTCTKTGKLWKTKWIKNGKGLEEGYKLERLGDSANLQDLFSGDIIKSDNFCVYKEYGGILGSACTLPCQGRQPCIM